MQEGFYLLVSCSFVGVNGEKSFTCNEMPVPSPLDSCVPCQ